MVTRRKFHQDEIGRQSPYFSSLKTTIETAFYANHVLAIKGMDEAYQLAASDPGSIVLDMPVIHTAELGLPSYARVLLSNSGAIVGRTAKARRIFGQNPEEDKILLPIIRSAIFQSQHQRFYKADAIVGLDEDFMVCAHLMAPAAEAAISILGCSIFRLSTRNTRIGSKSPGPMMKMISIFSSIPIGAIPIILMVWPILILSTIVSLFWG